MLCALMLSACEPSFVEVTFDGVPKCEGSKLTQEIVVKLDGPRVSSMNRLNGDGAPMTAKLVAGKLYKLKAYKCTSEPCEAEANLFHGADLTAPEGKTGRLTLALPGAPGCVPLAPPPAPAPPAEGAAPDAG
jgi:hypothetical protein